MSRWRLHKVQEAIHSEKMKVESLEMNIKELQNRTSQLTTEDSGSETAPEFERTGFPSLDASEFSLSQYQVKDLRADLNPSKKDLTIQFEFVKAESTQSSERFYFLGLLHGAQGLLSLPPAMASRKGDPILYHRGLPLNDIKSRRAVRQTFQIGDFIDKASGEPLYLTVLLFDHKGTLIFRKRIEPQMKRIESQKREGNP